ncbi:MAG: hypothetical protein K9M99_01745 [Candidatus Cloacimonetes bacterium]|nr:hypothetical protein [Candidatus Cloacimonadota bacterium]
MKKLVFILLFLVITLFASAVSLYVHIDPNGTTCHKIVITLNTDEGMEIFPVYGQWFPGQSYFFSVYEPQPVNSINVYGKNTITGISDTYLITNPSPYFPNHAYIYLPAGVKPPIGEPGTPD